ncbi:MAG: hypothetical protein GY699_15335 [Desulfobacteraceae bacterium]|nr:hypothetical protein [Desulfobacteraceae bacterium]
MLKENSVKISVFNKSTRVLFLSFFLGIFALLWQLPVVFSQTYKDSKEDPLHVISDKMVAQADTSMVEFIGNVKVTRLDSTVLADSIKIYFYENDDDRDPQNDNSDPQNDVKKIVSTGNVEYTAGERKAFADQAVYTTQDEILVLTGRSPKLITGSSFVTGKKITLFRKNDKVIVESDGSQRVEALFNPEDKITDKP